MQEPPGEICLLCSGFCFKNCLSVQKSPGSQDLLPSNRRAGWCLCSIPVPGSSTVPPRRPSRAYVPGPTPRLGHRHPAEQAVACLTVERVSMGLWTCVSRCNLWPCPRAHSAWPRSQSSRLAGSTIAPNPPLRRPGLGPGEPDTWTSGAQRGSWPAPDPGSCQQVAACAGPNL